MPRPPIELVPSLAPKSLLTMSASVARGSAWMFEKPSSIS